MVFAGPARIVCLLLALALSGLVSTVSFAAESHADSHDLSALIARIDQLRERNRIAGAGLLLVEGGKTTFIGGLGDLAHGSQQAVTPETLLRIGSITKSFTALGLLKLTEEKTISLDTPLRQWISPALFHNPWANSNPVTLAQLLEHSAGFTGISKPEFDYNDSERVSLLTNLNRYKEQHRVQWRPGYYHSYSNLGAALAGLAIENISHQSYETFIEKNIFKPLGMQDAGFFLSLDTRTELATGYDSDGVTPIAYWHMVYRPFGGINLTLRDMQPFLLMLLNRGLHNGEQWLSPALIERMETPRTTLAARSDLRYGYGAGSYQWLRRGVVFHGHGGDADGYLSRYAYTRQNDSGYFLVITAYNNRTIAAMTEQIEQYLTRDVPPIAEPPAYRLTASQIAQLTGRYEKQTHRFGQSDAPLLISSDGIHLFTGFGGGNRQRLIAVNEKHFRRLDETTATIAIVPLDNGDIIYAEDSQNYLKISASDKSR